MRSNNANFDEKNSAKSKSPRFVIEIDFSEDETDLNYFTSHNDIPTVTPVTHGVLKNTSSISQKLMPERANSSIGTLSFDLIDASKAITALFNSKRVNRKVLFGKRVRLYLGYEGMAWADYRLEQTQYIGKKVKYKNGVYSIPCKDPQDRMNKQILEPLQTRLSVALSDVDLSVQVYNPTNFELVARDADHLDAPNTSCTYIEISDNNKKEYCRVTAIGSTNFTVVRGVLGSTAQAWALPDDANDEKGPKIKELIFVQMKSLKLAYAIMTGDLLNQTNETLPAHWHLGMNANLLNQADYENQDNFSAYSLELKKTDGKKFLESEIMLPNARYFRVNGAGSIDLKRLFAINNQASPIFTLDESNIIKYGDLEFDSSDTYNKFSIEWSYDPFPKKPEYRRKSTFVFADSVTDYSEKLKPLKFRLINGAVATSTTLQNTINSFADRYAGEAARLNVSTFSKNNNLEVGDVVIVKHASIQDFNTGASINRSMQIISTKVNQIKGTVDLELFGSTFTPAPLSDGVLNVMNNSFYTAAGTLLPNVTAGALTSNTTLVGSTDHNNSVWYVDGDLTINAGVTLTLSDNVQLRVKGHLTVLGNINGAGNGRVSGGGFIGTTIGGNARVRVIGDSGEGEDYFVKGSTNQAQYEAFPIVTLDNPDGLSIAGIPVDLRGSAGATGGTSSYTDEFGTVTTAAGGSGNDSGSALVIICRGMSITGAGAIDVSGVVGNPGVTNGFAVGGYSSFSSPGGFLVLIDGGLSSVPKLVGRVTALSSNPNTAMPIIGFDIKQNASRIQFIPQARVAVEDDPIDEQRGTGSATFKQDAEPTKFDCYAAYGRGLIDNDLWIETDNNNRNYSYVRATLSWVALAILPPWDDIISPPIWARDEWPLLGLDSVGDLARDIKVSRLDSSNVMRRASGGLYSGALDANLGADLVLGNLSAGGNSYIDARAQPIANLARDAALISFVNHINVGHGDFESVPLGNATLGKSGTADIVEIVNDTSYSGNNCLRITNKTLANGGTNGAGVYFLGNADEGDSPVKIPAGRRWLVTYWGKAEGFSNPTFDAYFRTPGVLHPRFGSKSSTAVDGVWTQYSGILDMSITYPNEVEVQFRAYCTDIPESASFCVDQVSLFDVTDAPHITATNYPKQFAPAPRFPSWLTSLDRPVDLTDGRISLGLNVSGDLNRNIQSSRLDSSNVLRRTAGGLFNGALDATLGATWGVDVGSRPTELTDGRIVAGLDVLGDINRNVPNSRITAANVTQHESSLNVLNLTNNADVRNSNLSIGSNGTLSGGGGGQVTIGGLGYIGALNAQVNSPSIAAKINFVSWANASGGGEIFFHGYNDAGVEADVDPKIIMTGVLTTITKGYCNANEATGPAWIIYDSSRIVEATLDYFLAKRKNGVWTGHISGVNTTFTPTSDMWVIGVADQDAAENVASATVWNTAQALSEVGELIPTEGATWGTNIDARPIELTDNRIAGTIESAGNLVSGAAVDQGNGVYRSATRGLITGSTRDGNVVNFTVSWDQIPSVKFSAGGLAQSSSLSGDQFQDVKAINISVSGFTVQAKLKEVAGTTTARTDTGAVAGTQDFEIHKTQDEAFDNSYMFQYDVTIRNQLDSETGDYFAGNVSVGIYTNNGSGWVKRATVSHSPGSSPTTLNTTQVNQTRAITVTGLTNHVGREFGISIESDLYGSSTINFDNVTYTTALTPAETSATPSGAPSLEYFVLGGE